MIDIVLLGGGNIATNLYHAFISNPKINLVGMYVRSAKNATNFAQVFVTNNLPELPKADLYLLAVSDSAIATLSEQMPLVDGLVAHTSGSIAITAIKNKHRRGVFYPVQTFNTKVIQDFTAVPIAVEANQSKDLEVLENLAKTLNAEPFVLNSEQRKYVHLAAVYVNNFVNQLYGTANQILNEQDIPFQVLKPLIKKTAMLVQGQLPQTIQTGPAVRDDQVVVKGHLDLLDSEHKQLYNLLTQAIQNTKKTNNEL